MMKILPRTLVLLLLASAFSAHASPIYFVPADQTVDLGDQAEVQVWLSPDPGVIISLFDFNVLYDETILSVANVAFGSGLGSVPGCLFCQSTIDLPGTLNIAELAELTVLFDLALFQDGSPFMLASILFDTIGAGTSALDIAGNIFGQAAPNNIIGDFFGFATYAAEPGTGSITVTEPPVQVPEPAAGILLLNGLLLIFLRRRRQA